MRRIEFYKPALRFLKTVPAKHGRQIIAKIDELARAEDPSPVWPVPLHWLFMGELWPVLF